MTGRLLCTGSESVARDARSNRLKEGDLVEAYRGGLPVLRFNDRPDIAAGQFALERRQVLVDAELLSAGEVDLSEHARDFTPKETSS